MADDLRPRRSVLYMPAANARAPAKAQTIPCDAIIFDLADAVAPDAKAAARDALAALLPTSRPVAAERDPARSSVAPRAPARVPGAPAPMPGKRPASAGKRLAARFVSELIVVGMIFGIGLLVLVLLPKINPNWDLYKWVSSLFG